MEHDNEVYLGVVESDGEISLRHRGAVDSKIHLAFSPTIDDHNNPAIVVAAGKPLLAFYNFHNQDRFLRYRKGSAAIEDGFGPVGGEKAIDMGGLASYCEVHPVGDTLNVFVRTAGRYWSFIRNTTWAEPNDDDIVEWTTPRRLFYSGNAVGSSTATKLYMASRLVGSTLRCTFANHPTDGGDPDVYYCEIDLTTGDITSGGATLGNILTLPAPITPAVSMEKITAFAGNYRAWVFDVGFEAQPSVLFCSFDITDDASKDATSAYKYAVKEAGTWVVRDIVAAGPSFDPLSNNYFGSAQIDPTNPTRIWLSRKDGSNWLVERWDTTDEGETWSTTSIASSTDRLVRPWPVVGGSAGREVIYNHFTTFNSYANWAGGLVLA